MSKPTSTELRRMAATMRRLAEASSNADRAEELRVLGEELDKRAAGTRRFWPPELEVDLARRYADTPTRVLAEEYGYTETRVYQKAQAMGLKKSEEYLNSPVSGRLRPGARIGGNTTFKKGMTPWNKGMKGLQFAGSEATQFKKGSKPQTWVPVGTEVVDPDGYHKRKVRDDAPAGQSRFNWVFVHVALWEEHYGQIPAGHAVVFRNGNKADIRIANLELVTRAELMRRNTIHRYPPALKQTIKAAAKLRRTIRKLEEERHEEQG